MSDKKTTPDDLYTRLRAIQDKASIPVQRVKPGDEILTNLKPGDVFIVVNGNLKAGGKVYPVGAEYALTDVDGEVNPRELTLISQGFLVAKSKWERSRKHSYWKKFYRDIVEPKQTALSREGTELTQARSRVAVAEEALRVALDGIPIAESRVEKARGELWEVLPHPDELK